MRRENKIIKNVYRLYLFRNIEEVACGKIKIFQLKLCNLRWKFTWDFMLDYTQVSDVFLIFIWILTQRKYYKYVIPLAHLSLHSFQLTRRQALSPRSHKKNLRKIIENNQLQMTFITNRSTFDNESKPKTARRDTEGVDDNPSSPSHHHHWKSITISAITIDRIRSRIRRVRFPQSSDVQP